MFKKKLQKKTIFLHIPKTAGQSIRAEFIREIGKGSVSNIQTYNEATSSCFEDVKKYDFFSGHIDFDDMNDKFAGYNTYCFTVLREPRERIASFYLYLKKEALLLNTDELALPQNTGKRKILSCSIEDYFFSKDPGFKKFIDDMYKNFYVRYFCEKTYRSNNKLASYDVDKSISGLKKLDLVGFMDNLEIFSKKLNSDLGINIDLKKRKINTNIMRNTKWHIFNELCENESPDLSKKIVSYYLEEDQKFYKQARSYYEN